MKHPLKTRPKFRRQSREQGRLGFTDEFTPKLVTVLKSGYGREDLVADAIVGLTVAIVALPLSMAIAIASGLPPERGLFTAIVGGFLVSALGGSRFQIGGPAGAFIVLVANSVLDLGPEGMALATMMAGLMLMAAGFLRLGTYIKFIPYPVTVGFTAGIAIIILVSQLRGLFGLKLDGAAPPEIIGKIEALWAARGTGSPAAIAIGLLTIALIVVLKRLRPRWPGMLIAIAVAAFVTWGLGLEIETIASKFGALPHMLPAPHLPATDLTMVGRALPYAFAFALLGAIESLLSAVVADGMSGRRHRSNAELVAQGVANIVAPLFGGMPVTGTIARTATNVRAGSRGPVSGMLHALFLLAILIVAAPLAGWIPIAALSGVLVVVAWNMIERHEFRSLLRVGAGDAAVLLAAFLLTVFRDLTEGIIVGVALGSLLFIKRMSDYTEKNAGTPLVPEDTADRPDKYLPEAAFSPDVVVYRVRGAFFFGAATTIVSLLEQIADTARAVVIDLSHLPFLDSTAARALATLASRAERRGVVLCLAGATPEMRRLLRLSGAGSPKVRFFKTAELARARLEEEFARDREQTAREQQQAVPETT